MAAVNIYELIRIKENASFIQNGWPELDRCRLDSELDKEQFDFLQKAVKVRCEYRLVDEKTKDKNKKEKRKLTIAEFSPEQIEIGNTLDKDLLSEEVRIMISDARWLCNHDQQEGIKAQEGYYNLYRKSLDQNKDYECGYYIKWSLSICEQKKNIDHLDTCLKQVHDDLLGLSKRNLPFLEIDLLQILMQYIYDCKFYHFSSVNGEQLLPILDRLISDRGHNFYSLQMAYQCKESLLRKLNQTDEADHVKYCYAERLMEDAALESKNPTQYGEAGRDLEKAAEVFTGLGEKDKHEEALKKLLELQKQALHNAKTIYGKETIPEQYRDIPGRFFHHSTSELLHDLIKLVPYMDYANLRRKVLEKRGIFSQFASTTMLDESGRKVACIPALDPTDEANVEKHMYMQARKDEQFIETIVIKLFADELQHREDFSEDSLQFLFQSNPIVPEGRESILQHGLYIGLYGDPYCALHLLAPQTEHLFFRLYVSLGKSGIHQEENVVQKVSSLEKKVFAQDSPLKQTLGENAFFTFNGLLVQETGSNIRNNIAHGLWSEKACEGSGELYFIVVLMKLLAQYGSP